MRYGKTFYLNVLNIILLVLTLLILVKHYSPMLAVGIALYLLMGFDDSRNKFFSRASEQNHTVIVTDWIKNEVKATIIK